MRAWGLVLLFAILAGPAQAQEAIYLRKRDFPVPFNIGAGANTLQQLQLYVSSDFGKTWQPVATAPPNQGYFRFTTERDGTYWFAVQTTDRNGRNFPANMDGSTPNLKVVVDTTPPAIDLRPLPQKGAEVGVAWQVKDESFNANAVGSQRLEYRLINTPGNWITVEVPAGATQLFWNPASTGPVDVRFQARDQAGNIGEAFTKTGGGITAADPSTNTNTRFAIDPGAGTDRFPGVANPPSPAEVKLVRSKRVAMNYDLKDRGPSGLSGIELWYTQDNKNWTRYSQPFQEDPNSRLVFELDREGLYGITLVARSGVGLGDPPPKTGDRPQLWIEVDMTKPQVALGEYRVGRDIDKGKIRFTWKASDRNLAPKGITLRYATEPGGQYNLIAENLANTGEYIWVMPAQVPYQFYVKVEAADLAGNVGEDVTTQPVRVDLSHPRAIPRDISPAN
jgi:hypothetical protein